METARLLQQNALRQLFRSPTAVAKHTTPLSYTSQQPFRARPAGVSRGYSSLRPKDPCRVKSPIQSTPKPFRRFQSSQTAGTEETISLSQRLKKLSREYGWAAVGVYLALSALDFPFCFLAVRTLGTDRIGHWEHVIMSRIKGAVKWPMPEQAQEGAAAGVTQAKEMVRGTVQVEEINKTETGIEEEYEIQDHGYKEAAKANSGEYASIWTQLALAYAIHKSFIFIRVPLTAAVLPKVVRTLRGWGWKIGKMPSKKVASGIGANTKGTGVKAE